MKKKWKYWYLYYVGECPVCGANQSYKERQYTKRPKSAQKRYKQLGYNETYDYCDI